MCEPNKDHTNNNVYLVKKKKKKTTSAKIHQDEYAIL